MHRREHTESSKLAFQPNSALLAVQGNYGSIYWMYRSDILVGAFIVTFFSLGHLLGHFFHWVTFFFMGLTFFSLGHLL